MVGDLVERNPAEAGDFGILLDESLIWIFELGEEENDFFLDVEVINVIGNGIAVSRIDDDVEVGLFFGFAEGGLDFGFAGLDVTLGEVSEVILLVDHEDRMVFNNDSTTRFLEFHRAIIA